MQSESRMPQSSVMGYGLDWAMATEAQYSICLTLCHDLSLLTHHFVQTCMSLGHIPGNCMWPDMHACGMACRVYKRKGESERANTIEFVVSINKVS